MVTAPHDDSAVVPARGQHASVSWVRPRELPNGTRVAVQSGQQLVVILDDLKKTNATVRGGGGQCFTKKVNLDIVLRMETINGDCHWRTVLQGYGRGRWLEGEAR